MKKFFKWIGIGIAGLFIIGILGSMFGGNSSQKQEPTNLKSTPATTSQPASQSTPQPKANKPSMNKAEFDQLKSGMSYKECTVIIGGPGEVVSESGSPGDQFYTVMYQYKGDGELGANANLMFQGDKLANKAQMGLK